MATIYYCNKSGNDSNDGLSHDTAKLTIGGAVTAASSGDTIKVGTGIYKELVLVSGKVLTFEADGWVVVDGENIRDYGFQTDKHITVTKFIIKNCSTGGIAIPSAQYMVITTQKCIISNCPKALDGNAYHTEIIAVENIIYDCSNGIYVKRGQKIDAYNNTIDGCSGYGFYLQNDLITKDSRFKDNIISNCSGIGIYICDITVASSDYNDFYNCTKVGKAGLTEYTTLTDWQTGTGLDANSIDTDPQFNDIANKMFGLKPTSPCLGIGTQGYIGARPISLGYSANINLTNWQNCYFNTAEIEYVNGKYKLITGITEAEIRSEVIDLLSIQRKVIKVNSFQIEDYPTDVLDIDITDSAPNRKNYEYRSSNSAFGPGDATPFWTKTEITDDIAVTERYFQIKWKIRRNGTEA